MEEKTEVLKDTESKQNTSKGVDMNTIAVGAYAGDTAAVFNDKNITFGGSFAGYSFDSILRDKQKNIIRIFELCDYFCDEDSLIKGIIKEAYTPFAVSSKHTLVGKNEKAKADYEEYYKRIDLEGLKRSIFYQFFKYANVYIYLAEDGNIMTLPVHRIRIGNMTLNGEPLLEMDISSITQSISGGGEVSKTFVKDDDLKKILTGFPPEVIKGVKERKSWVQLNPENTFVLQDLKEDWTRYSVPMITACLSALNRKALIRQYEQKQLGFGASGFLHVKYGDVAKDIIPTTQHFSELNKLFLRAMRGLGIASTNNLTTAEFINPDLRFLFENDKYKGVNEEILSAGGISGVVVSGQTDSGSSFASAKVSMDTAILRVMQVQESFCVLMDKINQRVNGKFVKRTKKEDIPKFEFEPIDLNKAAKFREVCFDLWKQNVLSSTTLLQNYGIDVEQELTRLQEEEKIPSFKRARENLQKVDKKETESENKQGRPSMDETDRTSDENNSMRGKQPKPSNPEGSL